MKINNILSEAKNNLKSCNIPTPFLDAELLLAYALGKNREFIICYPDYELSKEQIISFRTLLKRRKNREPVAKIIGQKEFWGRNFVVNNNTLDPRPDSETIIEAVFSVYQNRNQALKVLDFGTGSGCLLLTILAEYPNSQGIGVDIDEETLYIAKLNSHNLGLANRSDFVLNSWGEGMSGEFNLVISNPPYIKDSDIKNLEPEVSLYEPYKALAGGLDGLDCYRILAPDIANILQNNGYAILEFGIGQDNKVNRILVCDDMKFIDFRKDLSGVNRCIIMQKST